MNGTIPEGKKTGKEKNMKIIMVLYPCPSREAGEETPMELLGCADKALGLRE
jgi:hypothetical protein